MVPFSDASRTVSSCVRYRSVAFQLSPRPEEETSLIRLAHRLPQSVMSPFSGLLVPSKYVGPFQDEDRCFPCFAVADSTIEPNDEPAFARQALKGHSRPTWNKLVPLRPATAWTMWMEHREKPKPAIDRRRHCQVQTDPTSRYCCSGHAGREHKIQRQSGHGSNADNKACDQKVDQPKPHRLLPA
jgi:hypothetical protein